MSEDEMNIAEETSIPDEVPATEKRPRGPMGMKAFGLVWVGQLV